MGGPTEVPLSIRILLGIVFIIAGVIVLGDAIVATYDSDRGHPTSLALSTAADERRAATLPPRRPEA